MLPNHAIGSDWKDCICPSFTTIMTENQGNKYVYLKLFKRWKQKEKKKQGIFPPNYHYSIIYMYKRYNTQGAMHFYRKYI